MLGETWHGAWWEALSKVKVNSSSHWDILKKSLIKKKEKKKRKVFKRPKFLGFVSYEWVFFSLNCTALTRPLTNLTKIDSDLVKQPLCREPHLRSPYLSPIYSAGWCFKQEGEAVQSNPSVPLSRICLVSMTPCSASTAWRKPRSPGGSVFSVF